MAKKIVSEYKVAWKLKSNVGASTKETQFPGVLTSLLPFAVQLAIVRFWLEIAKYISKRGRLYHGNLFPHSGVKKRR